jgi:NADH-quinone oxidoreductase subunit M
LLAGTLLLGWNHASLTGVWSFDLLELDQFRVITPLQSLTFFLLFYGLAIRIPLFPLHGWWPRIAEHGSIAVAPVFLLGVKTGIYGMYRFMLPLLSEAVTAWHTYVVAFAVAGVFYGALLAFLQDNLRRLLAFAVLSHSSILIIGLFSLNQLAFHGTIMLSVNFGLAIAGLLFMTGLIYKRTRTTLLPQMGGLFDHIPYIGITFLIAGLAIVGMPGTPGFDAAHLVLEAAMERFGALVTIAAALGNVAAAGFLLWAFQRAFLAPYAGSDKDTRVIAPASWLELLLAGLIVLTLLGLGFYSQPWLDLIEHSMPDLAERFALLRGVH